MAALAPRISVCILASLLLASLWMGAASQGDIDPGDPTTAIVPTTLPVTSDDLGEAMQQTNTSLVCNLKNDTFIEVPNSRLSLDTDFRFLPIGKFVTYTCDSGYQHVAGNLTRTCQGGEVFFVENITESSDILTGLPPVCTDIDECNVPTNCAQHAACTNFPGTFQCGCPAGFTGDGVHLCEVIQCYHPGDVDNAVTSPNTTVYNMSDAITYSCSPGYAIQGALQQMCVFNYTWQPPMQPTCNRIYCGNYSLANSEVVYESTPATTVDSTITFSCDAGFELQGPNSSICLGDGNWSTTPNSVSCKLVDCGQRMLANGITMGSASTYNSAVMLQCQQGYALSGGNTSTCLASGLWSNLAASCEKVNCGVLASPINGTKTGTLTTFDSSVMFTCDVGHSLVGSNTSTCQANGAWSSTVPQCPPVECDAPALRNGVIMGSTFTYPNSVYFTCNSGYMLVGRNISTCLASGAWSNLVARCEKVDCGVLDNPDNGTTIGTLTTFNNSVTFTCDTGHNLVGGTSSICQSNRTWSSAVPQCLPVDCGTPASLANGVIVGSTFTYPNSVSFTCNSGYMLIGSSTSTCLASRVWSNPAARCEKVDCGVLDSPDNGTKIGILTTFDNSVTFTCDTGHYLVGSSSLICQSNGTWSSAVPQCLPVDCGSPASLANGTTMGSTYTYPNSVYFTCDVGHMLIGTNASTCQVNATWSTPVPQCLPVDCGRPVKPANGALFGSTFTYRNFVSFTCNPGYDLTGSNVSQCLSSGIWTSPPPACVIVDCRILPPPINGYQLFGSGYSFGDTVNFACNPGYTIQGSALRRCQDNRLWSGSDASCLIVSCPASVVQAPQNGTRVGNTFTFGSTVLFDCNPGYLLTGTNQSECQSSASWTSQSPMCLPVDCGSLQDPTNGCRISSGTTIFGSAPIVFGCSTGYNLIGANMSSCLATGSWSSPTPECRIVDCGSLDIMNATRSGVITTFGSVLTFRCVAFFYQTSGDVERHCLESGQWNGTNLVCPRIYCPEESFENGEFVVTGVHRAEVRCHGGYNPVAAIDLTCSQTTSLTKPTGEWQSTGESVNCTIAECPMLNVSMNVMAVGSGHTFNSTREFSCKTGFEFSGSPVTVIRCLPNGTWSGAVPTCKEPLKANRDNLLFLLLLLLPLLLLIVLIILCLCYRPRRKSHPRYNSSSHGVRIKTMTTKRSVVDIVLRRKQPTPSASGFIDDTAVDEQELPDEDVFAESPAALIREEETPLPETSQFQPRPEGLSKQFSIGGLARVLATDDDALRDEYRNIPMNMAPESDVPPGASFKNRYRNVLPNAHSRVPLPLLFDSQHSDYINANFVRGYQQKPRQFIATQGPLLETVGDFWRMIWAQKAEMIVMLTRLEEKGKEKCHCYWPMAVGDSETFDDLVVTCKEVRTADVFYVTRTFNMHHTKRDFDRVLTHYWFLGWPDHGVPDKVEMLSFVEAISPQLRQCQAPCVAHCSAGIGRTGAFIAIDTGLQELEASKTCDILRIVSSMREDRGGLVQNHVQYLFVYDVLNYCVQHRSAVEKKNGDADVAVVANSAAASDPNLFDSEIAAPLTGALDPDTDTMANGHAERPPPPAQIAAGQSSVSMTVSTNTLARKADRVIDDMNEAVDFFDDQLQVELVV